MQKFGQFQNKNCLSEFTKYRPKLDVGALQKLRKMTGETPEVRSDKRRREEREEEKKEEEEEEKEEEEEVEEKEEEEEEEERRR